MDNWEKLFLDTLDDLENRIRSNNPYEILGVSALIRKLFLDSYPLVDRVNRRHKVKIRFEVTEGKLLDTLARMGIVPSIYSPLDGLDPHTSRPGKKRKLVGRDSFFKQKILVVDGRVFSIREIILFEANIMGGVHVDSPKTEKDKVIDHINKVLGVQGYRFSLRLLQVIGRIVLRALDPLRSEITKIR